MSYTIYKSTSGLIAQPGRTVATFPSGLVRVEQTYLGLTANATLNRAILAVGSNMPDGDSSPCLDGLKIFPEVQEVVREDGFTEYKVCAYGRCNYSGNKTFSKQLGVQEFTASFVPTNGSAPTKEKYQLDVTCDLLIWKFVTPKTASPNVSISENLNIFRLTGQALESVQIAEFFSTAYMAGLSKPTQVSFSTPDQITLAEAVNYGHVDEWTVCYKAEPQPVSLGSWQRTGAPSKPDQTYSYASPGENVWPGVIEWNQVSLNGSAVVYLVDIVNDGGTAIPATNTPTPTTLGGSAKINGAAFYYAPPSFSGPPPVTVQGSSTPPAPAVYTTGAFTFNRVLKDAVENNGGSSYTYEWVLQEILETFEVTLKNENNQVSTYSVNIRFADFDNAD